MEDNSLAHACACHTLLDVIEAKGVAECTTNAQTCEKIINEMRIICIFTLTFTLIWIHTIGFTLVLFNPTVCWIERKFIRADELQIISKRTTFSCAKIFWRINRPTFQKIWCMFPIKTARFSCDAIIHGISIWWRIRDSRNITNNFVRFRSDQRKLWVADWLQLLQ